MYFSELHPLKALVWTLLSHKVYNLKCFFLHPLERETLTKKGYSSFLLSRKSSRNWNQTVGTQSSQKLWFYAHLIKNISQKSHYTLKWPAYYEFPFCFLLFCPVITFLQTYFQSFFPLHLHFYSIMLLPIHFPLLTVCPPVFDWVRVSHITH